MKTLLYALLSLLGACSFESARVQCIQSCPNTKDFICPEAGGECLPIVVCGNGIIEGDETCDDNNPIGGDGCDETCTLEPGWTCIETKIPCIASECGDGILAGNETCDDGGNKTLNGCDQNCQTIPGFYCPNENAACLRTSCGNGIVEGHEGCDDQNNDVGDGCTPTCSLEPKCTNGSCSGICGDGFIAATETCDDGNAISNDGCSDSCNIESGFQCMELSSSPTIRIPVTYRDFISSCGDNPRPTKETEGAVAPFGHPDFECPGFGLIPGMVEENLNSLGKPIRIGNPLTLNDEYFSLWYQSNTDFNRTVPDVLSLSPSDENTHEIQFLSFYPLTDIGFDVENCDGTPCESPNVDSESQQPENFYFTSEARWWFTYKGDEVIYFGGDDDVWIFVNGRLAIDLGGIHLRAEDSIDLSDATVKNQLNLTEGNVYEIAIFHAERHTVRSQYQLTLTNFAAPRIECANTCGDGIVSTHERCDFGDLNGDGDGANYGGCTKNCTFEPRCGDGIVQVAFGEVCDDGLNLGSKSTACAPGCKSLGGSCGDGVVQTGRDEQCDDGNNIDNDGCTASCLIQVK